jgi:hypothetical protein
LAGRKWLVILAESGTQVTWSKTRCSSEPILLFFKWFNFDRNASVVNFVAAVSSEFNKTQHFRPAKLLNLQGGNRSLAWSRTRFQALLKPVDSCCF